MSPNSFYSPCKSIDEGLRLAHKMVEAGAQFIDIGGEATNVFVDISAEKPSLQQELDRVIPLIEAVKKEFSVLVSIDTSEPQVMQAAIDAGVDMINDQRALKLPDALEIVAKAKVLVCLMHFFSPQRKAGSSSLAALLEQIKQELLESTKRCLQAGIKKEQIIVDPGFGGGNYGKNSAENFYLLANLPQFIQLGYPLLVGWSRKSMVGEALGNVSVDKRLYGSIAAATISALYGASIIRVHDVKETIDAMKIVEWIQRYKG